MKRDIPIIVALLLIVSTILLGILVPGGPVETRDFSHISPMILGSFNTFLTALGLGSVGVAYFAFKRRSWAFLAATICGVSYLLVYLLDLWQIFPVSPDAMPPLLWAIEVAGSILSIPLIAFSIAGINSGFEASLPNLTAKTIQTKPIVFIVLAVFVAIGIIWFATNAAMH